MPIELKGGSATVTGQLTITDENNLHGSFKAELVDVSLSIPKQEGNELANTINQSLSTIDRISISLAISGTIENYQLYIKSNLAEIVSKAIKKAFAEKIKNFESSLMSATQSKAGYSISGLLGQNKSINDSGSAYGGLLGEAQGGASGLASPKGLSLPSGLKLPF